MSSNVSCTMCGDECRPQFCKGAFTYYRCRGCSLLSTSPIPDAATIESHYAKAFQEGNYGLGQEYMRYYIKVYENLAQRIERYLAHYGKNLSGMKVLDIGCFTGELLLLLQKKGADVSGVELQEEAVAIAQERLPGRIFKADVFSENFPDRTFDLVIMSGVIEHVVDPMKLLIRSRDLLNPGGILLLQTPNSTSTLARMMGKYWPPCAPIEHIHLFSKNGLQQSLESIGFRNVSMQAHWKKLPCIYVYNNFQNFGPELYKLFRPLYNILPKSILEMTFPFYVGEMLLFSQKPSAP